MDRRTLYIQFGDTNQCDVNGISGYEFRIGYHTEKFVRDNRFRTQDLEPETDESSTSGIVTWNAMPEHLTTFKLKIIYE